MKRIFAGAVVIGIASTILAPTAQAAVDTTGPNITMQVTGHLLTHVPVSLSGSFTNGTQVNETAVMAKWSGSDPSGICDYQVWSDSGRDAPSMLADVGKATSFQLMSGDLDQSNGGYNETDIEIRAEDCAGNWSVSGRNCGPPDCNYPTDWPFPVTDRALNLMDNVNYLYSVDDNAATYSIGGVWTHSTCTCFMGGTNIHAVKAGAAMAYTYTGQTFGLVSEYGPTRGSFKVYQDGIYKATVSLYAATGTGAETVWSNWFPVSGVHTIKIVVIGTAGHPRVDVDGFFTGPTYP